MSQINKQGVDLSQLIRGASTVWYFDEDEKEIYIGKYLGPAEEGYLEVDFGTDGIWEVHPDSIMKIIKPEPRWE